MNYYLVVILLFTHGAIFSSLQQELVADPAARIDLEQFPDNNWHYGFLRDENFPVDDDRCFVKAIGCACIVIIATVCTVILSKLYLKE